MCRVVPYAAINYAAHETLSRVRPARAVLPPLRSPGPPRQWLTPPNSEHRSPLRKFVAGALTGMASTILTYPIDVARARMAVAPRGVTTSIAAAFGEMWRDPRRAGAFYAGLTPTLAGIVPYSGTTWATYETLKERALRRRGEPESGELPPAANAVLGGFAGICGQTVSYPMDVVRRRMQTAVLKGGVQRAPSMAAVFLDLVRTEGLAGMYKGLSVNFLKAPVAMGISFSMFAAVKQALEAYSKSSDEEGLREREEGRREAAAQLAALAGAAAAASAATAAGTRRRRGSSQPPVSIFK